LHRSGGVVTRNAGEEFGVLRELGRMHEREAFGAFAGTGDDEAGYLHHLTVTARSGLRALPRGLEMASGFVDVAGHPGHKREQDVVDRVHRATMTRRAYSALTDG
jgi:hypothetical protein